MPDQSSGFRDFGILPNDLPPPPERVRSFLSAGRIVGQYIGTGIVAALGLGLTALFVLTMTAPLSLLGCAAALLGFGSIAYLATHNDYRWVELEGNTLRAKHLYTGRIIERSVDEIDCLGTMVYLMSTIETAVIEGLLGRIKGIEIRFRDGRTPLRVLRSDPAMTNAKELIEAVIYRMMQIREVETEIVDFKGQPFVRRIHWKGEQPNASPGNAGKIIVCCLILLVLLFGTIGGYLGLQEQHRRLVLSVPPHAISLRSLIQNGPGDNLHVTVTDFRAGGYAFESKSGTWTHVWIALFPQDEEPGRRKEINVVLSSESVRDIAELRRLLQDGRITGICSSSRRSSWGTVLGPNLIQQNQGTQLSSAWVIEDMREPPSETKVMGLLAGSAGCLALAALLGLFVFLKFR